MGSNTTGEVGIYKPAVDEENWGTSVNSSLDDIDSNVSDLMYGKLKDLAALPTGATPSVSKLGTVKTNNGGAVSVTNMTSGTDEQFLWVFGADAGNTTFEHGSTIVNQDAEDILLADDDYILYQLRSSVWYEVLRSTVPKNSVGSDQLKWANQNVTITDFNYSDVSIGTARYHWPRRPDGTSYCQLFPHASGRTLGAGAVVTGTWTFPYHSSSPPHILNGEVWSSFAFVKRNKKTLEIVSAVWAMDPIWCMDETAGLWAKDDPRRIQDMPHPWAGQEIDKKHEVVLIDLRDHDNEMVDFSREKVRVRELAERHKKRKTKRSEAALFNAVFSDNAVGDTKRMRRIDALRIESEMRGIAEWDLIKDTDFITRAVNQVIKPDGTPFVSGVEEFDSVVKIVKA